jgi:tetratricopeptide (TPR) repeat protein
MGRRFLLIGAAATLVAAALALGGSLCSGPRPGQAARQAFGGIAGAPSRATEQTVERLQAELRGSPRDGRGYADLGLAYEQRARETGDPSYYSKADGALRRALRLRPGDLAATAGLGSLALSRHRFRQALALGRRVVRLSPTTAVGYGIVGDALVELGRYRAAFAAFNRMGELKPGVASYSRIAYGRELLGATAGAEQALRLAVDAASAAGEPTAWTHWQLGKLYWSAGRAGAAEHEFRAALAAFPGYPYALDALAQAEAASGHARKAIELERRAVDAIPLPQFVANLGDLYRAQGRTQPAHRQYALIGVIQRLLVANGVKTDLEAALFDIDHGIRLRHALAVARRARAERPSIDGDDVLAWALARNGRCQEALAHSRRALRLGTRDALKLFHRGMIERCLGHRAAGNAYLRSALAVNPHFSIVWAPVARKALG